MDCGPCDEAIISVGIFIFTLRFNCSPVDPFDRRQDRRRELLLFLKSPTIFSRVILSKMNCSISRPAARIVSRQPCHITLISSTILFSFFFSLSRLHRQPIINSLSSTLLIEIPFSNRVFPSTEFIGFSEKGEE